MRRLYRIARWVDRGTPCALVRGAFAREPSDIPRRERRIVLCAAAGADPQKRQFLTWPRLDLDELNQRLVPDIVVLVNLKARNVGGTLATHVPGQQALAVFERSNV